MVEKKKVKQHPNDYYSHTQQEVADELGISREAVSDIERRALRKLKKQLLDKLKRKKEEFL
jgi:RNA polymerase sigma factor (sigma-70 family)